MRRVWSEITKQPAVAVSVFAAMFMVAVLVTLVFAVRAARAQPESEQEPMTQEYRPRQEDNSRFSTPVEQLTLSDFVFHDSRDTLVKPRYYYYRESSGKWTQDEVDRFWVPTQEVILDTVYHENDRQIRELLDR